MTDHQLKALQNYVAAVAYFMLYPTLSGKTAIALLAARSALENAFGQQLVPPFASVTVDLFADVAAPTQKLPDLL